MANLRTWQNHFSILSASEILLIESWLTFSCFSCQRASLSLSLFYFRRFDCHHPTGPKAVDTQNLSFGMETFNLKSSSYCYRALATSKTRQIWFFLRLCCFLSSHSAALRLAFVISNSAILFRSEFSFKIKKNLRFAARDESFYIPRESSSLSSSSTRLSASASFHENVAKFFFLALPYPLPRLLELSFSDRHSRRNLLNSSTHFINLWSLSDALAKILYDLRARNSSLFFVLGHEIHAIFQTYLESMQKAHKRVWETFPAASACVTFHSQCKLILFH